MITKILKKMIEKQIQIVHKVRCGDDLTFKLQGFL